MNVSKEKNKNISALIINADNMICDNISPNKALPESSANLRLVEAINSILYNDIAVIWVHSATNTKKHPLKIMLGDLYKKIPIIEQGPETEKQDPDFYRRAVYPTLEKRSIALDEVVLISAHKHDIGAVPAKTELCATVTIDSPENLVRYLDLVSFWSLFSDC